MPTQRMWVPPRAAWPCLPVSLLHDLSVTSVYCTLVFAGLRESLLLASTAQQLQQAQDLQTVLFDTVSLPGKDRCCADCL